MIQTSLQSRACAAFIPTLPKGMVTIFQHNPICSLPFVSFRIQYRFARNDQTINKFIDDKGKSPYAEWLNGLRDTRAIAKIIMQVDKMKLGLFSDVEPIGEGLSELRIWFWISRVLW